jgi:hypothetical protein
MHEAAQLKIHLPSLVCNRGESPMNHDNYLFRSVYISIVLNRHTAMKKNPSA